MAESDKRERILAAALELFAENGFHGSPAALIAQRAGVGAGTLYRYFKDKDDMIHELFKSLQGECRAEVYVDYPAQKSVGERFSFLFARMLRYFLRSPRAFSFMEQYHFSPYGTASLANRPAEELTISCLLEEGRRAGVIKDLPTVVLEALTYGPIAILAKAAREGRVVVDDETLCAVTAACWDSLKLNAVKTDQFEVR